MSGLFLFQRLALIKVIQKLKYKLKYLLLAITAMTTLTCAEEESIRCFEAIEP